MAEKFVSESTDTTYNYLTHKQIPKLVDALEKAKGDVEATDKIIRDYLATDIAQSREMGEDLRTSNSVMTPYGYEQKRNELIALQNSGQCNSTCQDIVKGSIADIDFQLASNKNERKWNAEVQPGLNLANDALMLLGPLAAARFPALLGRETVGLGGVISNTQAEINWGRGIQGQGMPWENYVASQLPAEARLPTNFKTFDFFDRTTGVATSAKTLDTATLSKVAKPEQVYNSLKGDIDAAASFTEYTLSGVPLKASQITTRELQVAVPATVNSTQWQQIQRAVEYGRSQGVNVIITTVR